MIRQRSSVRSRGSSSTTISDPRERMKDCCRKFVAFMCTQVGVGGLIVAYALIGAASFVKIEGREPNPLMEHVNALQRNCAAELWNVTEQLNLFNSSMWYYEADLVLKRHQDELADAIRRGYDYHSPEKMWSYSAALMFCLAVFTMIGYGNLVPRTPWGKGATVIYATFGIPLYILYFMNMGKVLASTFKWIYTWLHECSHRSDEELALEDGSGLAGPRKRIIVPSTACLWVITIYIATGTVMFAEWEKWSYLDSAYFCVTSLCKIGIGDLVPGTGEEETKTSKLVINFIYMLLGMGLVAMCYILMREEVRIKLQEIKEDTRLCMEDLSAKFAKCCGTKDSQYYD
ncbi:TWiK family of potassium channels protein 18 [Anopheles ziemanni]|uniref:Potassium channel domain-containing protein n=1 Tax=Anopheles sinensis TaxID=74873 RepID=A0A084VJ25_ANOSI|nr:TWiK family of potassium channels protein 18 [Anopheles coustani]XP_058175539.1 TWiK family of potassium channels protein 18 [Anopheles ziemanni]KFB37969.1 hypothetical protein ZHAS_00005140 [Anopheles sinensis]